MNQLNQFRRSGAGASCEAQAERDAPNLPPIVKLIAARPSIVNALFERATQEANARMFAKGRTGSLDR